VHHKKKSQAAFITVKLDKKNRQRRMATTEQVDPSILVQGQVVGSVSNGIGRIRQTGSLNPYHFPKRHPEGQPEYDLTKTLKQNTLQFQAGEPNRILKAVHSEVVKSNGSTLNPNSPTFVSRLKDPLHNLSSVSETQKLETTTVQAGTYKSTIKDPSNVFSRSPNMCIEGDSQQSPWANRKYLFSPASEGMKDPNSGVPMMNGVGDVVSRSQSMSSVVHKNGEHQTRPSPPNKRVDKVQKRAGKIIANGRNGDLGHLQAGGNQHEGHAGSQKLIGYLKHPLHNHWSFWYFQNERNRSWTENQVQIGAIGSIEVFWS